jgi:hypothetical protein
LLRLTRVCFVHRHNGHQRGLVLPRFGIDPACLSEEVWPIVAWRHGLGDSPERSMSHQPPKENKKKPQHTPKEKKAIKQQKKHASDAAPFIKH